MDVGDCGACPRIFNEGLPSLDRRLRPENPDEDRPVEGRVGSEPFFDVVIATQPDLEAETVWKRWGARRSPGRWFRPYLKTGLPKAIRQAKHSRAGMGPDHRSDACDQVG